MGKSARQIGYDNIKGILISLVVLGHFLELCPNSTLRNATYKLIYSFHMPAFLFTSGFFARYCSQRIRHLAILYGIFQLLYRFFAQVVLCLSNSFTLKQILFTPYWLLWFLPVLLYCHLLLPFWNKAARTHQLILLAVSVLIALLSGYCPQIGYLFSLSRFLVFLPFFLAGKLASDCGLRFSKHHILPLLCAASVLSFYLCSSGKFQAYMLYGSYPYAIGYSAVIRLQAMFIASVWICLLLSLGQTVLNKPLPLLSYIGAHTLPVYLLHGFAVKYIASILPGISFPAALICSVAVISLTGNPAAVAIFNRCLHMKK